MADGESAAHTNHHGDSVEPRQYVACAACGDSEAWLGRAHVLRADPIAQPPTPQPTESSAQRVPVLVVVRSQTAERRSKPRTRQDGRITLGNGAGRHRSPVARSLSPPRLARRHQSRRVMTMTATESSCSSCSSRK